VASPRGDARGIGPQQKQAADMQSELKSTISKTKIKIKPLKNRVIHTQFKMLGARNLALFQKIV
jgi:hypothetical protein